MKQYAINRRKFLRNVSIAGLGTILPRVQYQSQRLLGKTKIAVIGAGLAGLRASHLLSKDPTIDLKLFEASERAGGRIFTKYNLYSEGVSTEIGAEFIDSNHTEMNTLINDFELKKIDCWNGLEGLRTYDRLFHNILRNNQYEREWARVCPIIKVNKLKCERDINFARQLDNLSLSQYLEKYKITGWFADYINWIFTAEYGLPSNEINCLYLHDMFGYNVKKQPTLIEDVTDQRYKIKGGNQLLIDKLVAEVSGKILYKHVLNKIFYDGKLYNLQFINGKKESFDYIIIAIPLSLLRKVVFVNIELSKIKRDMISNCYFGTNSKIILGFKERTWRNKSSGYLITDTLQSGWDSSQLQNGDVGPGTYTFFMGGLPGKTLCNTQNHNLFLDRMELIYPGAKSSFMGHSYVYNWNDNPYSKGSYACLKSGQWFEFPNEEWLIPEGKIYFAGEHCATKNNQGFMNGAAESGRVVAEMVLKAKKQNLSEGS